MDLKNVVIRIQVDDAAVKPGLDKAEQTATNSQKSIAKKLGSIGAASTKYVTLPIAAAATAGALAFNGFETNLAKIVGLVGVNKDEVAAMGEQVKKLGPQYGKSAAEASSALFYITSAGLRGTDAMGALEMALKASASGLGDTATIADLLTSAMNAYGAENLSAANATDVLAASVREGKLEAAELSGAVGSVLPIASAMGVSFDEVGASLAAMSRTGTGAAEGATQLKGVLSALLKPSTEGEKTLTAMGLSAGGLRQQIKDQGLLSVLQTLQDKFEGNDEAAAQVFGNVRALTGVMDLMGSNAATTAEIFGNVAGATGAADDAWAAMADTGEIKMAQAMETAKTSLMELGAAVAPIVSAIAGYVTKLSNWFNGLSEGQKGFITTMVLAAATIGPMLIAVSKMILIFAAVKKAIIAVKVAQLGLNLAFLANPITWVVLAVVALIAAVVLAYKHSETFRNIVQAVGRAAAAAFGWVVEAVKKVWEWVVKGFTWVKQNWPLVLAILTGPIGIAVAVITKYWDNILGFFRSVPGKIATIFKTVANGITSPFRLAFNTVAKLWNATIGKLAWTVPTWVPGLGGKSVSAPKLPELQGLYTGGTVTQAGAFLVGEKGPEVVNLPAGAAVTPNGSAPAASTINITINGGDLAEVRRVVGAAINGNNAALARGFRAQLAG